MKITAKKIITFAGVIIILFFIFILVLNINDAIKNHLPITNDYIHVLEKVELIDHNGNSYSISLSTNKLAELRDFRDYNFKLGPKKFNVQFVNLGFQMLINNVKNNFSDLVKKDEIEVTLNGQSIKITYNVNNKKGIIIKNINPINTYTENIGDIIVKMPLKDGGAMKLIFTHGLHKELFFEKGYETFLQSSLTEKLIYWWYGIDLNGKKTKKF